MSSVECLREFVNERLTAAAEEIFGVFKKAIVEYEEEIDRQRKLLDIFWKPEIKLHRIELPQQHVCKEEEVLPDQQLCIQERNSSLDQEDPEPPQIKEEQEELCTSHTFMLTPTYEESDHSELEPKSNHQLLSHNSHVAERQDQKEDKHEDSGLTRNTKPEPQKRLLKSKSNTKYVYNHTMLNAHSNSPTVKKKFQCDTCEKTFQSKYNLKIHLRIHTGEKPYCCETCGKDFSVSKDLKVHMRTHTGEKPYCCKTCGKSFRQATELNVHMRIHTGENPFTCTTCGKAFRLSSDLTVHMRTHTGEKPYCCKTCGKRFCYMSALSRHIRIHTGEKPYSCKTCGRAFRQSGDLLVHVRRAHTGEKPYLCKTCGKGFYDISALNVHVRNHTDEKPYS